jgi:hypothetical protein
LIDDDPVQSNPLNMLYDFVVDGEVIATFTNAGDGASDPQTIQDMSPAHVYEGHVDDWAGRVSHPYDLMNDGRSLTWSESAGGLTESHQFQRRLISDIDATILAEGYGYTVNMPSDFDTMHATLQYSTDSLIVRGIDDQEDDIHIDMHAGQIRVRVNDTTELFDPDDVTQIVIHAGNEDTTTLETLQPAGIDSVQVNGFGTLVMDAASEAFGATWNLAGDTATRTDWSYDVSAQFSEIAFFAGNGSNLIEVGATVLNREYYFLGGNANDQFRINDLELQRGNVEIDGNGGTDTVHLYEPDNATAESYTIDGHMASRVNELIIDSSFDINHQDVENVFISAGRAGDEFNVLSTLAGVYTAIMTGEQPDPSDTIGTGNPQPTGPDVVHIGDGNYGHNIEGHVQVTGQGWADQVIVDDRPGMTGGVINPGEDDETRFHEIGSTYYEHSETGADVYYINVEQLSLEAGSGNDTINVQSTVDWTETTVSTGGGDDVVVLALDSQNLDSVAGQVNVEAGASSDVAVYLYDTNVGGVASYTVETNSVERSGFGGLEYDELEQLQLVGGDAFAADFNLFGSNAAATAIWGQGGSDHFTIYDASFEQLLLRGGLGSDMVLLDGPENAEILPNPIESGAGIMLIGDAFVHYLEMEQLQANHLESLEYVTPNAEDLLKLVEAGGGWHELIGTSGDVDLTPLSFQNIADLHLNLANNDQAAGDDLLAVSAGDLPEQGVEEVRVSSGTGRNQIEVQQGTIRLHASEGGYGVNTDVSVFNESTLVQFGRSQDLHSLEVRRGAEVELIASRSDLFVRTDSLMLGPAANPDGTIELRNHGLIVDYIGASPLDAIQQVIEHARVQNAPIYWTGTGISSDIAANSPDDFEVVAQEVTDAFPGGTGMFHGANLVGERAAVLVEAVAIYQPPLLPGDYNENGIVDAADSVVWREMLGATVTPYSGADGNGDGLVSDLDYQVWRSHFGATTPGLALNLPPTPEIEESEQPGFSSMLPESRDDRATEWGRAEAFEAVAQATSTPIRSHRIASHRLQQSSAYLAAVDEALLSIFSNEPHSILDRFDFSEPLDDSDSRSETSGSHKSVGIEGHASQNNHQSAWVRV